MGSISEKSLQVIEKAMAIADEVESHSFPYFTSQLAEVKQGPIEDISLADEMESQPHLSSFSSQAAEVKQSPIEDLSLEDIVWLDSCLNDPDASQIDWNSWDAFSLALSETMSSETDSPAARIENHPEGAVVEIFPSSQQTGSAMFLGTRAGGDSLTEEADENIEDQLISEQTDNIHSEINLENVFLPTWNENPENFPAPDTKEGVDFPGFVMEQSTWDIFKVWDLGLAPEEDEFVNQLNKALAQSSLEPSPTVSNDSGMSKGLKGIAIDNIISGISDLSLNHFPMLETPE